MLLWRWVGCASLVAASACAGEAVHSVTVDPLLTVSTFIGGDVVLVGTLQNCTEESVDVTVLGNGLPLASMSQVSSRPTQLLGGEQETEYRFTAAVPGALWSPRTYGLPAAADVTLNVKCRGAMAMSPPFPVVYLPTARSVVPPFAPRRFWPAQQEGDILACQGGELVHYAGATVEGERLALGFSCGLGEMPGLPSERRYLHSRGSGIAAIDPEPALVWTRSLNLLDARTAPADPPLVLYKQNDLHTVVLLDPATGEPLWNPVALPGVSLGPPALDRQGIVRVLLAERDAHGSALTYHVAEVEPWSGSVTLAQVAHYPWNAPTLLAAFDLAGESVYVMVADAEEGPRALRKLTCAAGTCAEAWTIDAPDQEEYVPFGEAWGRLLVATGDAFVWLEPLTGTALTPSFGPVTGRAFFRGHVELDGSLVLLADPVGEVARGLHVYAPSGAEVLALWRSDAAFRWLTPGWGDETLVSYFEELHQLLSRREYQALTEPP